MALCAAEVMEGVVAALNRLPLNLVPSEWVEQVELKLNANALKLNLRFLDQFTLGSGWPVHRGCGAPC